jgi:hypothetical protein
VILGQKPKSTQKLDKKQKSTKKRLGAATETQRSVRTRDQDRRIKIKGSGLTDPDQGSGVALYDQPIAPGTSSPSDLI